MLNSTQQNNNHEISSEEGIENLKRQLEEHYLKELKLITEVLSLNEKKSEKLYTWLTRECKSYKAIGEVIKYARGRNPEVEEDGRR